MQSIDPYSIEIRYTLDYMGYLLDQKQPRSVRIYSDSVEMVKAVVRRLAADGRELLVANTGLKAAVETSLAVPVRVAGSEPAEAAFAPLALPATALPREPIIVASMRNALSYKSLLYPGTIRAAAITTLGRVKQQYAIEQVVGLYPPRFVAMLGLAHLLGRRNPATYFHLSDRAMQHIYSTGPMWGLSYVVIFAGQR